MAFLERGNISVSGGGGCFDGRDTVICDSLGTRGVGNVAGINWPVVGRLIGLCPLLIG